MKERRAILEKNLHEVPNHIKLSEVQEISVRTEVLLYYSFELNNNKYITIINENIALYY